MNGKSCFKAILLWFIALLNCAVSHQPSHSNHIEDPYCPLFSPGGDTNQDDKVLNIHLVPHTHDDVGWLKTVDQYYYGLNNTIQDANVKLILDNVLQALLDTSTPHKRTFTYVEMKFFSKWYTSLSPQLKTSLKELIDKKQFTFSNGGWCMHDEATTHFMGQIDQTTLGHSFLKKELGVVPTVGWQIDPFGHSATQGGLLTSGFGFDSLFFGRIHYVDLEHRKKEAECEGLWQSSVDGSSVFWGLTGSYGGNYGGPEGFCFDELCQRLGFCSNETTCEDLLLERKPEDILLEKIKHFTHLAGIQANQTKGQNIMFTMGMDFFYSQAEKNFRNIDLLIENTNLFLTNGSIQATDVFGSRFNRVNVFYSTPERYTNCKYIDAINAKRDKSNVKEEVPAKYDPASWNSNPKTGDFFPYADCDHCYWGGYFSSRPSLKRMERVASSFLHTARQIESMALLAFSSTSTVQKSTRHEDLASGKAWSNHPLFSLEDASGIAQHHDCATGTSKQHVAYDYAKRLSEGVSDASIYVTNTLRKLLVDPSSTMLKNLNHCHLLNETICSVSQDASRDSDEVIHVIVYNALARARTEIMPLPVDSSSRYAVERLDSNLEWRGVDSSLIPNPNYAQTPAAAQFILYFKATDIPPLGAAVFRVVESEDKIDCPPAVARRMAEQRAGAMPPSRLRTSSKSISHHLQTTEDEIKMSNGVLSVVFDRSTGVIKSISGDREGEASVSLQHEYGYYEAFVHKDEDSPDFLVQPKGYSRSVNDNKVCLRNEMPWLLGSAQAWQNAGAYILRPTTDQSFTPISPQVKPDSVVVYESDLITEVHAEFGDYIKQVTRLIEDKDYVEVEYVVGPVPINDGIGKEIISRYSTSIKSDGEFYTDSNGREFIKRKRNDVSSAIGYEDPSYNTELEPVAANYYPVNAAIYIEDESHSLSVLVDRSQGGSSLSDGSLELLIQRRLLYDDARGVGEPLNETDIGITPDPPYGNTTRLGRGVIIKGTHRLKIGSGNGASQARSQMDEFFSQPHVFVASTPKDEELPFSKANLSMLTKPLPQNVMVVTFTALDEGNTYLIRLAHQHGKDESDTHSSPVQEVDLKDLFPHHDIVSITEKTLSGNQDRSEWEMRRFQWDDDDTTHALSDEDGEDEAWEVASSAGTVVLKPLEIRTFYVEVGSSISTV